MATLPPRQVVLRSGGMRPTQRQYKREGRATLSPNKLERETSLELATSTLARLRSTN